MNLYYPFKIERKNHCSATTFYSKSVTPDPHCYFHQSLHRSFHRSIYELELIHPFADGNGRIGRLWHTLLLTQWKPLFAWLPVESIIHDRQDEYYAAINRSNYEGESTAFIMFMLSAIKEALMEAIQTTGAAEAMTTDELRWYKIERFLKKNGTITNAEVRQMFQVSSATANRILAKFTDEGKLQKIRIGRSWGYQIP